MPKNFGDVDPLLKILSPAIEKTFAPLSISRKRTRDISFNCNNFLIRQIHKLFRPPFQREFHVVLGEEHDEVSYLVCWYIDTVFDHSPGFFVRRQLADLFWQEFGSKSSRTPFPYPISCMIFAVLDTGDLQAPFPCSLYFYLSSIADSTNPKYV